MTTATLRKIEMYIVSLWLLFLLIAVKEFHLVSWEFSLTKDGFNTFISANVIAIISLLFLLLGLIFYARFRYTLKGSSELPKKIVKIEDQNFEHLTFLTTYIIPFLRVKLEGRDLLVTFLLLIVIGMIFVKTNLFYKNPTLALLGYRLYKVDSEGTTNLIFISREPLNIGDTVLNIHLSDNIYFVKK